LKGSFMSPDLLAGDIGNPQSLNRYAYVRNNPLSLIDPTGMQPDDGDCDFDCDGGDVDINLGGWSFPSPPTTYEAPGGTSPNPPAGDPDPDGPFSGPVWQEGGPQITPSLAGLILPTDPACEFGACTGFGFTSGNGSPQWKSYVDYLDWLRNALTLTGSLLIGQIGHCYGGDAICIPGQVPRAIENIESANPENMAMASAASAAVDAAAGPADSILFGRERFGSPALVNSNDWLRIGWGWKETDDYVGNVFRITGRLFGGRHLDLWPPAAW
jgi:hypothetical protein